MSPNVGTLLKGVLILKCLMNLFPLAFVNLGFYYYIFHISLKKLLFLCLVLETLGDYFLCLTHTTNNMIALFYNINILYTKNLVFRLSIVFLLCLTISSIPIFSPSFSLR